MNRITITRVTCLALISATGAAIVLAGPLDPPAGPVASTFKTLAEVEPRIAISLATTPGDADSTFKITQRGSYYLTGNVTGQNGKCGIEITASNVTLDLMGCELTGVPGSLDGVRVSVAAAQVTVRNGAISLWREDGVDLSLANDSMLDSVRAAVNFATGAKTGSSCIVTGCVFQGNSADGIVAGPNTTLSNCTARNNDELGIELGEGATASNCTSASNEYGIQVGAGAVATACTARGNVRAGINVYGGGTASRCTANLNGTDGFTAGSYSAILECTAHRNGNGAVGAGITLFGTGARIDGNHLGENDYGIRTIGEQNIVIRNSARGNPSGNFIGLMNEDFGQITTAAVATRPFGNISGD